MNNVVARTLDHQGVQTAVARVRAFSISNTSSWLCIYTDFISESDNKVTAAIIVTSIFMHSYWLHIRKWEESYCSNYCDFRLHWASTSWHHIFSTVLVKIYARHKQNSGILPSFVQLKVYINPSSGTDHGPNHQYVISSWPTPNSQQSCNLEGIQEQPLRTVIANLIAMRLADDCRSRLLKSFNIQ